MKMSVNTLWEPELEILKIVRMVHKQYTLLYYTPWMPVARPW